MGGGDQKRLKESFDCPEGFKNNLKGQVEDLKFIVNHLKTDVTCTLESSIKQLKVTVEREIGLLVYSLMEEALREQVKLKDHLKALQKENSLLIENEGNIMDELARITLENEKLTLETKKSSLNETVLKELEELEVMIHDKDYTSLILIKDLKNELEEHRNLLSQKEKIICDKENELSSFKMSFNEQVSKIEKELKDVRFEIQDILIKAANDKAELEDKIKELVTMNSEMMDLGELGKKREDELKRLNFELENKHEKEKEILKEEIETLKKAMTAQKIELERGRETLNRERKLSALKISDLQEQVEDLKNNNKLSDENNNEIRNKNF